MKSRDFCLFFVLFRFFYLSFSGNIVMLFTGGMSLIAGVYRRSCYTLIDESVRVLRYLPPSCSAVVPCLPFPRFSASPPPPPTHLPRPLLPLMQSLTLCLSLSVPICVSIAVSVCLSLSVSLSLTLCLSVCLSVSFSLSVCLSLSVSLSLTLSLSLCVCLCLSVSFFFHL